MKCMSCSEDISPKFAHAISQNTCPMCGNEIMHAKLQVILTDLKAALDDASEYPAEVEDWLLSNYSLKKFDLSQEPQTNVRSSGPMFDETGKLINPKPGSKPISVNRTGEDMGTAAGDQEGMTDFAKRAGVKSLKRAVEHIQGAADPSEFGSDPEDGVLIDDGSAVPLDNRGKMELQDIFAEDQGKSQILELEKLKRLRAQGQGDGKIRR